MQNRRTFFKVRILFRRYFDSCHRIVISSRKFLKVAQKGLNCPLPFGG